MSCERRESVRDYALDEFGGGESERRQLEAHVATCQECARELQGTRLTTAALRILPEKEIPQRIAFVSDKVFQPSPLARFFGSFWNSAAKLGFASACILAGAITYSAMHRPAAHSPEDTRIVQTAAPVAATVPASASADTAAQIEQAVQKAVARVREEDARNTKVALAAVEHKYEEKQRALMVSVQENFEVMQKRLSSYTMLASADAARVNGQ